MVAGPLARARELPAGRVAVRCGELALGYGELIEAAEHAAAAAGTGREPLLVAGENPVVLLTSFYGALLAGRPALVPHGDWAAPERERALAAAAALPHAEGRALIGFTSGTSGTPKPFARSWESWASSFDAAAALCRIGDTTEVVVPGPLQHSHFLFGAVLAVERGAPLTLTGKFDRDAVCAALAGAGRAVCYMVPTMLVALAGAAPMHGVAAIVMSGQKLEPRHRALARELFPRSRIVEIFGASELSFVSVTSCDPGDEDPEPDAVGRPFPGVEVELRGLEDGAPLAAGEVGEIWVRSPYLAEGAAGADGFATCGDVGRVTPDGVIELRGRRSNVLISGGKNIHPEEVEAVAGQHGAVLACIVTAVADDYWGERLVGLVEAVPGTELERLAAELDTRVRARLAAYKAPKEWRLVERLPRTESGKLARPQARELAVQGSSR